MDALQHIDQLEILLISAHNALTSWYSRCLKHLDITNGNAMDLLVLQAVDRRNSGTSMTDVCFTLNIEDHHVVNYALKKLVKHDLLQRVKRGKKVYYHSTEKGKNLCLHFKQLKEQHLTSLLEALDANHLQHNHARKVMMTIEQTYSFASQQILLL